MTAPRTTRKRRVAATVELPQTDGQPTDDTAGDTAPDDKAPDFEVILPETGYLIVDGMACRVRRLQTREVMAGVRCLVNSLGATAVSQIDFDLPFEEQRNNIVGMLLVAAPDAADEVLELLASLVEPVDSSRKDELAKIMRNPPPSVTLDVIEVVVKQEKDDFGALMGKARQLLGYAQALQRTGKKGT
jgi:hypothetical protein